MAEAHQQHTTQTQGANNGKARKPAWTPGQFYVPGQDVPEGAQIVSWENGTMTLEALPPEDFDPEIRRKVLAAIDEQWANLLKSTDEHPNGRNPVRLIVNRAFRRWFPNPRTWGEECEIQVERDERRMPKGTTEVNGIKFRFLCSHEVDADNDDDDVDVIR